MPLLAHAFTSTAFSYLMHTPSIYSNTPVCNCSTYKIMYNAMSGTLHLCKRAWGVWVDLDMILQCYSILLQWHFLNSSYQRLYLTVK